MCSLTSSMAPSNVRSTWMCSSGRDDVQEAQGPQPAVRRVDAGLVTVAGPQDVGDDAGISWRRIDCPAVSDAHTPNPHHVRLGPPSARPQAGAEVDVRLRDPEVAQHRVLDGGDGRHTGGVDGQRDHVAILAKGGDVR